MDFDCLENRMHYQTENSINLKLSIYIYSSNSGYRLLISCSVVVQGLDSAGYLFTNSVNNSQHLQSSKVTIL